MCCPDTRNRLFETLNQVLSNRYQGTYYMTHLSETMSFSPLAQ